jgi:hypothetical protein
MKTEIFLIVAQYAALAGCLYLIVNVWTEQIIDEHRAVLFQLRYKLFDLAYSGDVAFESPVYRAVEREINLKIRHLHSLSLKGVLSLYVAESVVGASFDRPRKSAEAVVSACKIKQETKDDLLKLLKLSSDICLLSTFKRNFIVWVFVRTSAVLLSYSQKLSKERLAFVSVWKDRARNKISARVASELVHEELMLAKSHQ